MQDDRKITLIVSHAKHNLISILVGFVYLSFLFNYTLPIGITLSNIGLSLMLLLLVCAMAHPTGIRISSAGLMFFVLFVLAFGVITFYGAFISLAADNLGLDAKTLAIACSWLFMALAFLFGLVFSKLVVGSGFRVVASWVSIAVSALTGALIIQLGIKHGGQLRYEVNSYLPGGINGFMFGMTWLQVLALGLAVESHGFKRKTIIGIIAAVCPIILNIALESRQYGVAAFLLILAAIKTTKRGRERFATIFTIIVLFLGAVLFVSFNSTAQSYLYQRLDQTQRQITEKSSIRIGVYTRTLELVDSGAILGNGIGHTRKMLDRAADNFWLEFVIDYGVLGLSLLLPCIVMPLLFVRRNIYKNGGVRRNRQEYLLYVCILLSFFWYAVFNEIIREYIIWAGMGVAVGRSQAFWVHFSGLLPKKKNKGSNKTKAVFVSS